MHASAMIKVSYYCLSFLERAPNSFPFFFICNYYKVRYLYSILLCLIGRYKCTSTLSYMHLYKGTNTNIRFYSWKKECFLSSRNCNKIFNVFWKICLWPSYEHMQKWSLITFRNFSMQALYYPLNTFYLVGTDFFCYCWKCFPACLYMVCRSLVFLQSSLSCSDLQVRGAPY